MTEPIKQSSASHLSYDTAPGSTDTSAMQSHDSTKSVSPFAPSRRFIESNNLPRTAQELLTVSVDESKYPQRVRTLLGRKAPKQLYMKGNFDLLSLPGIGFCSSRKATAKGLEVDKDCAGQAATKGMVVVSGNASGVDMQAHMQALKSGGNTIFVLPEGINHFRIKRDLKPFWSWNNVLVISQFAPDDSWTVSRAMMRNALIISLSRAMIVPEAGEKGGTLSAGKETLKMGLPLFVAEYQDMSVDARGNKILLNIGAQRLTKNSKTHRANMSRVFECVSRGDNSGTGMPNQQQGSFL